MQNNRSFDFSGSYLYSCDTYKYYTMTAGYNYIPFSPNIFIFEGTVLQLLGGYGGLVAVVNGSETEQSTFSYKDTDSPKYLYDFDYKFLLQVQYIDGNFYEKKTFT